MPFSSELQPALAGSIGQGGEASMIQIPVAIEDHLVNAPLLAELGDEQAHFLRRLLVAAFDLLAQLRRERRRRRERSPGLVGDHLRIDVLVAAKDTETRSCVGA